MVGSWYPTPLLNKLSNYALNYTHQVSKIFMFVNRKSLVKIFTTTFFVLQYVNLTKPFSIFSRTKWWWILICFVQTWKIGFFDKDIQLWLLPYMTMGFIYGTPMFSKSNENCIACLVVCGATIYLAFVNDIIIEVFFYYFD